LISEGQTLAAARHRVTIPVVNMTTGQIEVFKTPHSPDWTHHAGLRMADVAVAAAAAPTYFPMAEVRNSLYVDGAIFASAPDLMGVHEA
jgi:patatin-like phospholipase/acyl hydrolase